MRGSERGMSRTVAGIYRNRRIRLLERPRGIPEGRVIMTIEEDHRALPEKLLEFGKYASGRMSTADA